MSVVMMALNQRRFLDDQDYEINVVVSSNEYNQIFLLGLGAEEVSEVLQLCSGEFVWISNDVSSKLELMNVSGIKDEKYPVCLLTYAYMHILSNFGKIICEVIEFDPETDLILLMIMLNLWRINLDIISINVIT